MLDIFSLSLLLLLCIWSATPFAVYLFAFWASQKSQQQQQNRSDSDWTHALNLSCIGEREKKRKKSAIDMPRNAYDLRYRAHVLANKLTFYQMVQCSERMYARLET